MLMGALRPPASGFRRDVGCGFFISLVLFCSLCGVRPSVALTLKRQLPNALQLPS